MSRKRFSVRDNRLQEAIGTVLQEQSMVGEGRLESLPLSLVYVASENPRYVGRISPEEIIAHREGRIDLSQEKGERAGFFNSVLEMAQSVERRGLLQPIVVKEENTGFCILIGERRYLAHLLLGRERIRAIIRPVSEEMEERSIRLIENLQREDLSFMEIIRGIEELDRLFQIKYGKPMDGQDLAAELHKHDSTCRRYLQIVRGPSDVRVAIEEGKITGLRPALALLDIESPEERKKMLQKIAKGEATETTLRQASAPTSIELDATKRRGRHRRQISLGAVKHPPVIQVLMRSVLGQDIYEQRYGALDWADLDQIQKAWDSFIQTLQRSTK